MSSAIILLVELHVAAAELHYLAALEPSIFIG